MRIRCAHLFRSVVWHGFHGYQPQNRLFRFAYGAVIAHCVGRGRSVQGSLFQVNLNSAPYVNVNDGLDLVH